MIAGSLFSQENGSKFFFDAVAFKSEKEDHSKLDVSVAIPYQLLKFEQDSLFIANYSARVMIIDTNDRTVAEERISRSVKAANTFVSQGGNGDFDYFFKSFTLPAGVYKAKVVLNDDLAGVEYERKRKIVLLDFDNFNFALSGTIIVSKIEQTQKGYKITPFLADNIAPITQSLFTVMEVYNKMEADSIPFIIAIYDKNDEIILKSDIITKYIPSGKSSQYFPMKDIKGLKQGGAYKIRTFALQKNANSDNFANKVVAGSERSVEYRRKIGNANLDDINLAIEQSIHAAYGDDMKYMREGKDDDEKVERFLKFWKSLDPTPSTERNEALDEYFRRISIASQRYRNWRSDRATAYIVYGDPNTVERGNPDYYGRVYERWTYGNGRVLIFLDKNGLGEYRLVQPGAIVDKFQYE